MVKHHLTAKTGHWKRSIVGERLLRLPVVHRRADLRRGEVQGRRLAHFRRRPAALHRPDPSASPVRDGGRDARDRGLRGDRGTRSCAATSSSSSSTASTWRSCVPCSTPAPCRPTTCGPSISTSTPRRRASSKPTGAGSASGRLPLDIIEVPDRRLGRAAIELVADATLDGDTECTVLLPRRSYRRVWQRFLHDRTADRIAAVLGQVPHVSATIVPFAVAGHVRRAGPLLRPIGPAGPSRDARRGRDSGPVDA